MTHTDLIARLDYLSAHANPGPYGVESYGSGTTYLTLGTWVGHYASERVPMMGGGRAEVVNSNVPSAWGETSRKGHTAGFLAELANAYRAGKLRVVDEAADALTAAQEREKVLEAALTRIENLAGLVAHDLTGRVEGGKVAAVYQCAEVARAALDAGQLCNSTVEMAECVAFSAEYEAGERDGGASPQIAPLEWVEWSPGCFYAPESSQYSIAPAASAYREGKIRLSGVGDGFTYFDSADAAKAAAQADYERRIRATPAKGGA